MWIFFFSIRRRQTRCALVLEFRRLLFRSSHGGGPWPYVDGMKQMYEKTAREFSALPRRLPGKPKAVLVISGHWEAQDPTVSTAVWPPMEYDYYGLDRKSVV